MNKALVSFCKTNAFKIDNETLKEKIYVECEKILGIELRRDYFPGPQPVAVEKKDFGLLKEKEYVVCEKSDGERGVLVLINIDNKPMCFMVNRSNEFFFLTLSFKKEVFEGSIFDGEMIKTNKGIWNYLIHDCMCYNGSSFIEKSHQLRYGAIMDFIVSRYISKDTDCFNIKTKIFYKYGNQLKVTWKHICETTENKIDGLIFTPVDEPIRFGRDYLLLKWKEPDNNTIDLLVRKFSNKLNLCGTKNNSSYIFKTIKESEQNYKNIVSFEEDVNGKIIEFKYSTKSGIFTPYRLRSDKNKPNGEITINNTIKNIDESISIDDFIF